MYHYVTYLLIYFIFQFAYVIGFLFFPPDYRLDLLQGLPQLEILDHVDRMGRSTQINVLADLPGRLNMLTLSPYLYISVLVVFIVWWLSCYVVQLSVTRL